MSPAIRRFVTLLAILAFSSTIAAQQSHKPRPRQAHSKSSASNKAKSPLDEAIHAMFALHDFQDAEISPDGKRVAWVESLLGPGGVPSANSAIFVAELSAPGAPKRITAGTGKAAFEEHDVAWSPDSTRLAFLSDAAKPGQLQLFVAEAAGGAAKQVTHMKGYLSNPGWSPDGRKIALLFTENATRASGPLVAEIPDEGVVSEEFLEQRLTLVDPATSRVRQISPADMYVYEFDWAPDSKRLAITVAHGNGDDNWYIAGLFTIDPSGAMHDVVAKPGMQIAGPRWAPDNSQILFIGGLMSDEPIPGGDIFSVPTEGGAARNITPGMRLTATSLMPFLIGNTLVVDFVGFANGTTVVERADLKGGVSERFGGIRESFTAGRFAPKVSASDDHKAFAFIKQSFSQPPEVWAGETPHWKQITHRNDGLKPAWGETKSLHWKSDDFDVQGWLTYPLNFDPAKKYPLVVHVHGGPAWATMPTWPSRWDYMMALPSQEYFVLHPNPRGSYGQGEKFTEANVKDFGYGDFRDIMAGVDEAIKSAPIDPERLGITGWSYGGYMTMWGVTQTNRFRAAVAGAGLSNWLSYYGQNKIDQWMTPYFGASVYDDPAVYARSSPITFIKNAKTPTLIVVGDRDGECPPPQSYEFWHAIKTYGVPTQFVIYPNEGHLFADPAHSRDVIVRSVSWFNQYLRASK